MSSVVKCICGRGVRRAGKEHMDKTFLVPLYPLNNIKITNYFSNKPRFNGVFLRDDLPRINDEVYVINIDDENIKGKYWVSLIADSFISCILRFFWNWIYSSRSIKKNQR